MKNALTALVDESLRRLAASGELVLPEIPQVQIETTRNREHGEYATNIALILAKSERRQPRQLAAAISAALPASDLVARTEVAGPGFINFFLRADACYAVVPAVLRAGADFGKAPALRAHPVQIEYVSANPTGPLHVGHGRGAAYGAALAELLRCAGYSVVREYYVNDAGRQMDILTISVWLRYLQLFDVPIAFPDNAYRGAYIAAVAESLARERGRYFVPATAADRQELDPTRADAGGEAALDTMIGVCRHRLGTDKFETLSRFACDAILAMIQDDLAAFGVAFDSWFSERQLVVSGAIDEALRTLRAGNHVYLKDGAVWFRSTAFGDEKDRVVVRENGQTTYFASDIAYHLEKRRRGYDRAINIWGADHHGYIARMKAAYQALGADPDDLEILLVQFATLVRDGEKVSMSTRSGEFVPLRQLIDEVGRDAARYFYVTRRSEQHLEFDLDLAKSQSAENPVYYIQYAHARICSVFAQLETRGLNWDQSNGQENLALLTSEQERKLAVHLARYPELILSAAQAREPHQIANYLRELAGCFHVYYNSTKVIIDDSGLRDARLCLLEAVRQVVQNGLTLLGVSAPRSM